MIRLKIGRTYQVRDPDFVEGEGSSPIVTITGKKDSIWYGDDSLTYRQNGKCPFTDSSINQYDLVEEVKQ